MSEHFLYALDISSILKHMYCKRMSQCMWCNVSVNTRCFRIALENFPESLSAHGSAGTVCEQGIFCLILYKISSSMLHVIYKCSLADISNRDDPLPVCIMTDHISKLKIQIRDLKMNQFTYTHACSIKQFQHCSVAKSLCCIDIRLLQKAVYLLNG